MCCQDGKGAIRQMLEEPAGWSAEAEGGSSLQEEPSAAAELVITLVPVQYGEALEDPVPLCQELPSVAAELVITLVPDQYGKGVKGPVPPIPPGQPGAFA